MRMKAKTYEINILIANHLQTKMFSRKQFTNKMFIPYVLALILILKNI